MISYDITDDAKRKRVHDILKNYGERVQFSVFECNLTEAQLGVMRMKVKECIDEDSDSIRTYLLCSSCKDKVEAFGTGMSPGEDDRFFVV